MAAEGGLAAAGESLGVLVACDVIFTVAGWLEPAATVHLQSVIEGFEFVD